MKGRDARRRLALILAFATMSAMFWFGGPVQAQATETLDVRVATADDDAEENVFGWVRSGSTDLDMIFDRRGSARDNEVVGIRFTGVAIPRNAKITSAYIEFQVDEESDVPTLLRLQGEASDDADPFTLCESSCYYLSTLPTTAAAVDWIPDPWLQIGSSERTADISPIIQELVNRSGWTSGNALAILVTGEPNSERTAEAFEGTEAGAPLLHVEWQDPGHVTLLKLTNGVENQHMVWDFTVTGPGVDEADSSPPATVDFGGTNLLPGGEYALCETGIPAGWTLEWKVDTDGNGVPDTIIPMVAGVNDDPVDPVLGVGRVYDPNFDPNNSNSNDTRCVNFVVDPDETLAFQIDNRFPGGEPRTIGFWKNWSTCSGGNQAQTAANNGGSDAGWYILDDLVSNPGVTIGTLQLAGEACNDAAQVLDNRDLDDGKKRASDGAYKLAAQLLAAQLNLSVGAETCGAAVDAVNAGQSLLATLNFDGTGSYLKGKAAAEANALASTLDQYNNGDLCTP